MTYTIVAHDVASGLIGLATASHSFNLAAKTVACTDGASPDVLVAAQAFSDRGLGRACIADILRGRPVTSAGHEWLELDDARQLRQFVLVTTAGCAAYTGQACIDTAGQVVAEDGGWAVGGNMLMSERVLRAIRTTFQAARERRTPIARSLLDALRAGHRAGGDYRGDRSAALIVRGRELNLDLRVSDHDAPLEEIVRLHRRWEADQALVDGYAWILGGCPADRRHDVARRIAERHTELHPDAEAWTRAFGHGAEDLQAGHSPLPAERLARGLSNVCESLRASGVTERRMLP